MRTAPIFALALLLIAVGGARCHRAAPQLTVYSPADGLLTAQGPVFVEIDVPPGADLSTYQIRIDGIPVAPDQLDSERASVTLSGLAEGDHLVEAHVRVGPEVVGGEASFALVALNDPDGCDVLNNVACVLPYPSARFLAPASDTPNGLRLTFPPNALPVTARFAPPAFVGPVDPTPFLQNDGYSPSSHGLMHFPAGIDLVASNAPRLDPQTRTFGTRGLDVDSPTLLIEWESGEQINHWMENDARPNAAPGRVMTFLRPAESLLPGRRYIIAVRDAVDASGQALAPEPVFKNIRDGGTSDIPAVESRRDPTVDVIERLADFGVDPSGLVLAYDFTVMSQENTQDEMLSMRDQALAWVDAQIDAGVATFTVDSINERNPGCADPAQPIWREIQGSFQVPLFLDRDLFLERTEISNLAVDANGTPVWTAFTDAPYGLAIPCSAFSAPAGKILLGHGLFGNGQGMVTSVTQSGAFDNVGRVAAATNWSGLSSEETQPSLLQSFIFKVNGNPDLFPALPDRLRQGMTNALVLTRMLDRGAFNVDPAFQVPAGHGAIDPDQDTTYLGISLGGVMGTFLAAVTADIDRFNVDVPGVNFPFLLYRSTQFTPFEALQDSLTTDSMDQQISIHVSGELWTRGEPSGYINHISGFVLPPLPGAGPKQMLVTAALHDQQVANLSSQFLARSLRIPTLEGSVWTNLPGAPDATGPQSSALIVYDTGALDVNVPAHVPFIPPLANEQAIQNRCDPHGQRTGIPASIAQLEHFFATGEILNFCTDDGVCNASEPNEISGGAATPCDPLL